MKRAALHVVAAVVFLSACASIGMNTVTKLDQLSPGMDSAQVAAVLGEPKSSQMRGDQVVLKYTLHQNWKGFVPYYFQF